MHKIKVIKLNNHAIIPTRATSGSAGYDLRACFGSPTACATIQPGEVRKVPTGLAIDIKDPTYAAMILPRSSMSTNKGLVLANTVGLIDSDYRGELMIAVRNTGSEDFIIDDHVRIAQLVFVRIGIPELIEVANFEDTTERGAGGFGSTGE